MDNIEDIQRKIDETINPIVRAFLDEIHERNGIPHPDIIEILIQNYAALVLSYQYAGIDQPTWTDPFLFDKAGDHTKGAELVAYLTKRYVAKWFEKDTARRDEILKKIEDEWDDAVYMDIWKRGKRPDGV